MTEKNAIRDVQESITRRRALQAAGATGAAVLGGTAMTGQAIADHETDGEWPNSETVIDFHVADTELPVTVEVQLTNEGANEAIRKVHAKRRHDDWSDAAIHDLEHDSDCTHAASVPLPAPPVEENEVWDGWLYDVGLQIGDETVRKRQFLLIDQETGEVHESYDSEYVGDDCQHGQNDPNRGWSIPGFTLAGVATAVGLGGLLHRLRTNGAEDDAVER